MSFKKWLTTRLQRWLTTRLYPPRTEFHFYLKFLLRYIIFLWWRFWELTTSYESQILRLFWPFFFLQKNKRSSIAVTDNNDNEVSLDTLDTVSYIDTVIHKEWYPLEWWMELKIFDPQCVNISFERHECLKDIFKM